MYISFHKDLNWEKYGQSIEDEKKLPFKMSQLYVSKMQHIKRFLLDYVVNSLWGIACGVFLFYQWYMFEYDNGISHSSGITLNSDAYGVFLLLSVSICADIWIARWIRSWDWLYIAITIFSLFWIPFDLWREQSMPKSKVTGAIYRHMIGSLIFDLNVLLFVAVCMIPYMFIVRWRMVVLEPHLYAVHI